MNRYKAVLVDDEESARDILAQLLTRFCPTIELVDICSNVEESVISIKKHQPDLVFLDIEMPNYAGYEIISFFDTIDFEIIFVTAYDNYAIKAFEVSAVDYLLKPLEIDRLQLAVDRFTRRKDVTQLNESYRVLQENLEKTELTKIIIPHQNEQKVIPIINILAFEANEAYTLVHTVNGERFVVSKNLKSFENLLIENKQFFRSHKSWLINLPHIKSYSKSKFSVLLGNDLTTRLSKYKKQEFELLMAEHA